MQTILLLRLRQAIRYLQELGLVRSILFVGLTGYFAVNLWGFIGTWENSLGMVVISTLLILGIHLSRQDHPLFKILRLKSSLIFGVEYAVLQFPLLIILLLQQHWLIAPLPLLTSFLIAFLPLGKRQKRKTAFSIPFLLILAFEWKSGLRQQFFTVALIYGIGLLFCQHFFVPPIALLLLVLTTASFYKLGEDRMMVEALVLPPRFFLIRKIGTALYSFFILIAPLLLIYLLIHYEQVWLMGYALFVCCLILSLAVLMKYASYEAGQEMVSHSFLLTLATLSLIVPFLSPVPLVMLVYYYRKADKNLSLLLYAYH